MMPAGGMAERRVCSGHNCGPVHDLCRGGRCLAVLCGNGRIEGPEVWVSAEVTGRVVESSLVEGSTVEGGDLLVRLEDADLRGALAQARAEAAAIRQEIAAIEEELATARHHLQTAEQDLACYRGLQERGTVAPQRLEHAENIAWEARGWAQALEAHPYSH
jgi:multidrug resistance efflux pump